MFEHRDNEEDEAAIARSRMRVNAVVFFVFAGGVASTFAMGKARVWPTLDHGRRIPVAAHLGLGRGVHGRTAHDQSNHADVAGLIGH